MKRPSPYPGLRAFRRDETELFFGREEQTDELLEKLSRSHFLAVVGPSGGGKSSLVQAGMLPALETGFMAGAGPRWRVADDLRPGSHPLRRLALSLAERALGPERGGTPESAAFLYANLRRGPLGLVEILRDTPLPPDTNLLVLVDQFEEIFRYREKGDKDEADAFVALLLQSATQTEVPIYVVLTMRSDYLGHCARFPGLPEAMNESQYLTPRMAREQRHEAIVGPARVFGGDVEPELVNRLLNDMGDDPDQLPLMQHVLMRMWGEKKSSGRTPSPGTRPSLGGTTEHVLTVADYEAAGGLADGLSRHADEAFGELDRDQQRIAAMLFRCLCEPGRDTRRPATVEQVAEAALGQTPERLERVLEVAAVFRRSDRSFLAPLAPEPLFPETILDISHECLIRQWKQLKAWVAQEAKSAEQYAELERTARRWKAGKAGLWSTPELDIALGWLEDEQPTEGWAKQYGGNLRLALDFLAASREDRRVRQQEAEARQRSELQHKARKRYVNWLGGLAVALGFALVAAIWFQTKLAESMDEVERQNQSLAATNQGVLLKNEELDSTTRTLSRKNRELEDTTRVAQARSFAAASIGNVGRNRQRSLLLALYSVSLNSRTDEAEDALRRATSADAITLRGHAGRIREVAVSGDGRYVATASDDGTAKVWDARSGRLSRTLRGHSKAVRGVAFGTNGSEIATASEDGTARLWSGANTRRMLCGCALGHRTWVGGISYRSDHERLATVNDDSTVQVWDAEGHDLFKLSDGRDGSWRHAGWIRSIAFGPDTIRLATGGEDGIAAVWDIGTRQAVARLDVGNGAVTDIAFSADGQRLVTGSEGGLVIVWDLSSRERRVSLEAHAYVTAISLRPDGLQLATAGTDRTVRLWDPISGAEQFTLPAHTAEVTDVAFTPDGTHLVTGSADGTARIWDVPSATQIGVRTIVASGPVLDAAFCLKEDCVATAADSIVEIWDGATGRKTATLRGHHRTIWAIAFSPDGSQLATAGFDTTVHLWNTRADSKGRSLSLHGHTSWVSDVTFSPDGRRVATGSIDSTAKIWDAQSGELLHSLPANDMVWSVAFSPDNKNLAITAGPDVQIFSASTFQRVATLRGHAGFVLTIDFSPDRRRVATGASDSTVRLWDLRTGANPTSVVLTGHEDAVWSVDFSPDGRRLVSGGNDGTVRIWDTQRGKELYSVRDEATPIHSVEHSPDGRRLVSTSLENFVHIDPLHLTDLIRTARRQISRALTDAECLRYLHRAKCPRTVESLIARGRRAAQIGAYDTALASLRRAKAMDSTVDLGEFEREVQILKDEAGIVAHRRQGWGLLFRADSLSRRGRVDSLRGEQVHAILVDLANADTIIGVSAEYWNRVCWYGSLWGHASLVLDACERGVERSRDASYARDSRGVARTLTGNLTGAIDDFRAFVEDKEQPESQRIERREWVGLLQNGTNPFTQQTLRSLLSQ